MQQTHSPSEIPPHLQVKPDASPQQRRYIKAMQQDLYGLPRWALEGDPMLGGHNWMQ
jgi:hypothetical protein